MNDTTGSEPVRWCGLGCELPYGHDGLHDDLAGNKWDDSSAGGDSVTGRRVRLLREIDPLTARSVLAYIAGYAPEVFDEAVTAITALTQEEEQ